LIAQDSKITSLQKPGKRKIYSPSQILDYLYNPFPNCFFMGENKKILMANIHLTIAKELGSKRFEMKALKIALERYTSSLSYLHNVKLDIPRINLQGESAGRVTKTEEAFSKARLNRQQDMHKNTQKS